MKNFGSRKHKSYYCYSGRRDRLSELPDEVLVHILSFLPIVDAVRTLLLRRFGKLWTLVPNLEFNDFELDDRGLGIKSDRGFHYSESLELAWSRFSQFVGNVLALYSRPTIDGFILRIRKDMDGTEVAVADIQRWMNLVLSNELKALTLDFCCEMGLFYGLPSCIFTSQSLVSLHLENCAIEFAAGRGGVQVHMGCLKRLTLYNVEVDAKSFNELESGCPSLEEVFISEPSAPLSISASSIHKLDLEEVHMGYSPLPGTLWTIDCPNLKILSMDVPLYGVEFVNLPSVHEVTFNSCLYDFDMDVHKLKRLLQGLQNAQILTLQNEAAMLLTYCSQAMSGFPHARWKHVALELALCDAWIGGICSLVRNSPCLEELIIHVYQYTVPLLYPEAVSEDLLSPCVASGLRLVSMSGYAKPYEGQLRLAEFLLKSAVNLEKLVILSNKRNQLTTKEELEFVKKLSNFPRSSAKARIVFG